MCAAISPRRRRTRASLPRSFCRCARSRARRATVGASSRRPARQVRLAEVGQEADGAGARRRGRRSASSRRVSALGSRPDRAYAQPEMRGGDVARGPAPVDPAQLHRSARASGTACSRSPRRSGTSPGSGRQRRGCGMIELARRPGGLLGARSGLGELAQLGEAPGQPARATSGRRCAVPSRSAPIALERCDGPAQARPPARYSPMACPTRRGVVRRCWRAASS